jgi:hypothetical protein
MTTPSRKTKLTPPELARLWGVDVKKVMHWVKSCELRAIDASTRRGGRPRYLIDVADVVLFEAARAVQLPAARVRRRRADPNVIEFF